jgi:gliding motility-associated-like protein
VTVTGSFTVPAAMNLCQLLAVIDASQQCACAGDVAQVTGPIEYQTGLAWTVCSNANQPIGIPAMPGFDYQWSPDDCLADPQAAMTIFNCENDGILPETFQFTLTESNGFCEINNALSVTVQPVPGIAYADSPICQGESANLAATDGVTFAWQGPGIAQPNQQIVTVTPASTSQYSVTVTDAFGCIGSETTTVVVGAPPILSAGPDDAFCPGDLAQLNATNDPDFDYLWSPQTVNGQPALSDPTVHNPLVLVGQTTTFTLSVLDENGCSAMDAVTVSFADSLLINMPPDLTICTGDSTILTVTSNIISPIYNWTPDDGICPDFSPCSSYLVFPTVTTNYTVVVTSFDGCSATGSVQVTVSNDLIVTNGPPIEICTGETVVINGQAVSQPGIYCDTISIAGSCDSVYCVEVMVKPGIDTTVVDTAICLGASLIFEGQSYSDEGEYCVTFPGQNGCDSVRCLVLLVEDLGIKTTIDSIICQGDSVFFEGQFYSEPGEHCVTYSTPDGCDSLSCLNLIVNDLPIVEIVGADTVASGDTLVMELNPGGPFGTILWFANDSLLADCTGELTCPVSPTDSMVYTVQVTDPDTGCSGTDSLAVTVIPDCNPKEVAVPNAFSPNGDSMNDVFDIVGPGAEAILNMRIWNRWGQKVYDGPGPWDGKQNGKDAPSDVYIYLIKVGCAVPVEDMEEEFKGDVTLLR